MPLMGQPTLRGKLYETEIITITSIQIDVQTYTFV